jgi:hypothetical protein
VGRLPTSAGYTYCFTAVDRFIRWPDAIPTMDITANNVSRTLLTGWISPFGCPQAITTYQGRQFESQRFHSLHRLFFFFNFSLHLQSVPEHSANVVKSCTKACRRVLTSTLLYLIGSESSCDLGSTASAKRHFRISSSKSSQQCTVV